MTIELEKDDIGKDEFDFGPSPNQWSVALHSPVYKKLTKSLAQELRNAKLHSDAEKSFTEEADSFTFDNSDDEKGDKTPTKDNAPAKPATPTSPMEST